MVPRQEDPPDLGQATEGEETVQTPEGEEHVWWQQAYDVLSGMQPRGMFISPQNSRILIHIRNKLGL